MTKALTIDAFLDNIPKVTDFVDTILEENGCSVKAKMQIDIAIDELFANIAQYAYVSGIGNVTIEVEVTQNPKVVSLTFIDTGVPYNPLAKKDPDINLLANTDAQN